MSQGKRATWGSKKVYRRKPGANWEIRYMYRGKWRRESSHSTRKRDAIALLKQREHEAETGCISAPAAHRIKFAELADALIRDYQITGKRSLPSLKSSLKHIRAEFDGMRAVEITADEIERYVLLRQSEAAKPASIRNELLHLHRMFSLAVKKQKLRHIPPIPTIEVENTRRGFLEPADFEAVASCIADYDLRDALRFLYLLGWRVGEMRTLDWWDLNLDEQAIRLRDKHSKTKEARVVPFDALPDLETIIERRLQRRRLDCPLVFHRDGQPIGDFRKAWATACRKAGLAGILVHDFRRSAVRNMVRSGMPASVAMEYTGHKSRSVFERYNITSLEDMRHYGKRYAAYVSKRGKEPPKIASLSAKLAHKRRERRQEIA